MKEETCGGEAHQTRTENSGLHAAFIAAQRALPGNCMSVGKVNKTYKLQPRSPARSVPVAVETSTRMPVQTINVQDMGLFRDWRDHEGDVIYAASSLTSMGYEDRMEGNDTTVPCRQLR